MLEVEDKLGGWRKSDRERYKHLLGEEAETQVDSAPNQDA